MMTEAEQNKMAEEVATDMVGAVDAWLKEELEKVLGKKIVIGIGDKDFDSILACHCAGLHLVCSHTIQKGTCIYYFKLMQRDLKTGQDNPLSKYRWVFIAENYNKKDES